MNNNARIFDWEEEPYRLEYSADRGGNLYATSSNREFNPMDGEDTYTIIADNLTDEALESLRDSILAQYKNATPTVESLQFFLEMNKVLNENTTHHL